MVAGWNPIFFLKHRFHILHFPNPTGLFTKPTGRHYTKYRFSPDIETIGLKYKSTLDNTTPDHTTSTKLPSADFD